MYEFLEGENPGKQFADAIRESRSSLRNRVREKANDAQGRLQSLQSKVDDGTIAEANRDKRTELKIDYDYDDFERDIFYIFKSMFLFTERWGREGRKETDGCLIIPGENEDYFIASYDPKLTYDIKGYDLNASEKNKAAYYMLSESKHNYPSNILKDGDPIDCHIFVSDIFREGQFDNVVDSVREWFSLTKGGSTSFEPGIVFLTVDSLLNLYNIFTSNYDYIIEYSKVQKAFREEFKNELRITDKHSIINSESVENVKEKVLEARSGAAKKKAVKSYTSD